jgi:predicted ester cyclase
MASRNVETCRSAHQAFNRRDFEAIANTLIEEVVYLDRARENTFRGKKEFKAFMQGWVTAFPDAQITEPTYIDAGDAVIAQFLGRGTNDGPFGPFGPTGKPVRFHFCEILRFNEKGLVVSGDAYYDQLSIMIQLGHVPAPQQAVGA